MGKRKMYVKLLSGELIHLDLGEKTVREGKQMLWSRQIYPDHQRWFLGEELSDADTVPEDAVVCVLVEEPFEPRISTRDLARKRRMFIEEYADVGDIPQTVYWVDLVEDELQSEFVVYFIQKRDDKWSYFRGSGGLRFLDRVLSKVNLMGDEIVDRIVRLKEVAMVMVER
jgi:hypothetical protein